MSDHRDRPGAKDDTRLRAISAYWVLTIIAAASLLIAYGVARQLRGRAPTVEERISRAYGHPVGHCKINEKLTREIRTAGGGQTAYLCGDDNYSAIVTFSGAVSVGGKLRSR